jgi:hypothetical protein
MHWGSEYCHSEYKDKELPGILKRKLEWVFQEPTKYIPFGEKEEKRFLERLIDKTCRERFGIKHCSISPKLFKTLEEIDTKILTQEHDTIIFHTYNYCWPARTKDIRDSLESTIKMYLVHRSLAQMGFIIRMC